MEKKTVKAEPKPKSKIYKLELSEVEACKLRRAIDIATAGVCPADIKEIARIIMAKLK